MKSRQFVLLAAALVAICAVPLLSQSDAERVIDEALKPSPIQSNLEKLTDEIGGRVPGTPAMQRALRWGVDAFQDAGVFKASGKDEVHLETFTIANSWSEGATSVRIVGPEKFKVRAVSLAWTPATNGVLRTRVVDVGEGTQADFAKASDIAGAVVLVHTDVLRKWDDLFAEYLKAPPIIDAAVRAKAAAIAFMATREHDILYRHINTSNGKPDRLPMFLIAREDGERMARLIAAGEKLEIEADLPNKIGGPFQSSNVVAELKGSEKPDEFVVIGAHLDSWELGTGALDNGCNAALVVDALRAIKNSGVHLRRSIRFILFSGEEQGTLGSLAYVRAHKAELDNNIATIIFDEGTGAATGFSLGGRTDLVARANELVASFKQFSADQLTTDAFWGTDNMDFLLEGVPTFVANQKEANYLENYHATSDTYDKVDFPQLKKHVAIAAALAVEIANAPERLGPRQSRLEIEQLLHDTHLDDQLKIFGIWPEWQSGARGRTQ